MLGALDARGVVIVGAGIAMLLFCNVQLLINAG
jgi:hypothetical protein